MDPSSERRLRQLLSAREKGVFNDSEMAFQFSVLAETIGLDELLAQVSPEFVPLIKQGIALQNHEAADKEFLQPEDSPFSLRTYYQNVASTLFDERGFGARRYLNMVCLPSFEPEWALVLVGSSKGSDFSLFLCVAQTQIWSANNEPVAAKRLERDVSPDVALALVDIWQTMLQRARHPKSGTAGLDGVAYHFESGLMSAKTWSPDPETAPGKLVSLCHGLYGFVQGSADPDATDGEIRQAIESIRAHCRDRYGNE